MPVDSKLHAFMERIFAINPINKSVFGNTGRPAITPATNSAGTDVIRELHFAAHEFAQAVAAGKPCIESAQKIEASLLTLQILGQLTTSVCDELIDEVHDIAAA